MESSCRWVIRVSVVPLTNGRAIAQRVGGRGFVLKSARPQILRIALDSLMLTGYYYTESSHELLTRNPEMKTRQEREREGVLAR